MVVNKKRRSVDKSMLWYIYRRVLCTTFFLYTFSRHILLKFKFYQQIFNIISKLTGAYILLLKTAKKKKKKQRMNDDNK